MKKQFDKVKSLNKLDKVGIELALCKLFEEAGELAQAVNKKIGRKVSSESDAEIKKHITEECGDTIQNVFCIADKAGITFKDICDVMNIKNTKWENNIKLQRINTKGNTKVTVKKTKKK